MKFLFSIVFVVLVSCKESTGTQHEHSGTNTTVDSSKTAISSTEQSIESFFSEFKTVLLTEKIEQIKLHMDLPFYLHNLPAITRTSELDSAYCFNKETFNNDIERIAIIDKLNKESDSLYSFIAEQGDFGFYIKKNKNGSWKWNAVFYSVD